MIKRMALFLVTIMLLGLACAWAETATEVADLTGDWTMDYFGIPMFIFFHEDGTYEGLIDMDVEFDEGNDFSGTWEFDGTTMIIRGDDGEQTFTWDGEKLTGVMYDNEVVIQRAVEPEEPEA